MGCLDFFLGLGFSEGLGVWASQFFGGLGCLGPIRFGGLMIFRVLGFNQGVLWPFRV